MRKNRRREDIRLPYVVLGLILGFFLGSGLVYWYFNRQNGSVITEKTWSYMTSWFERIQPDYDDMPFPEDTVQEVSTPQKSSTATSPKPPEPQIAESQPEPEPPDTLMPEMIYQESADWLHETEPDTIFDDYAETAATVSPLTQDIRMLQDQLLATRTFLVPQESTASEPRLSQWQLDSLLGAAKPARGVQTRINIEFWMSPLYYTGYKKSKNRVIVYGLEQPDLAAVRLLNSGLLLRYMDNIYLLEDNEMFQPLVPISDPFILQQLQTP
jgi:hypothetical protein